MISAGCTSTVDLMPSGPSIVKVSGADEVETLVKHLVCRTDWEIAATSFTDVPILIDT